jgi:hypothetical protein
MELNLIKEQMAHDYSRSVEIYPDVEAAVDSAFKAGFDACQQLLQQTPYTTQLPGWAVELLTEVRQRLLVDLGEDGEPRSSMAELMAMWDKVNEALNLKTIGQLR